MKFIKLFTFLVYLFITLTNVFAFPDGIMCLNLDGSVGGYGCVFRRVKVLLQHKDIITVIIMIAMKMINFYINNQNLMEQFH